MVGDPRQYLLVEMVDPIRYRTALAKAEKRVIKGRFDWIGGLGRLPEPETLAIPRIERQLPRIEWPIKVSGCRDVVPGDVAIGGYRRERVALNRLARQRRKDASFDIRRAQSVR